MLSPLPRRTERTVLRRLCASDLPRFQAYRHEPGLGRFQGWSPQADADAAAFIQAMAVAPMFVPGQWLQLAIAARADDRLIGDIGLLLREDAAEAEIGFTLGTPSQGQGLAREAVAAALALVLEHTEVARVIGITDARNLASIRLLQRLGMRCIATQPAVFRGEPCVEQVYAIVRDPRG